MRAIKRTCPTGFLQKCCTVILVLLLILSTAQSQTGCPPGNAQTKGWATGSTVTFSFAGFTTAEENAIKDAFAEWNKTTTAKDVTFQFTTDTSNSKILIVPGRASGRPASTGYVNDSSGFATSANMVIDINNLDAPAGQQFFDKTLGNYLTALKKVVMHEIGHTMGEGEEPASTTPGATCGGQTAGNTLMNGMCGTNDSANNLPTAPTQCDKNTIAAVVGGGGGGGGGGGPACTYDSSTYTYGPEERVAGGQGLTCATQYVTNHYTCEDGSSYTEGPFSNGEVCDYQWPYCEYDSECGDPDYNYCSGGYCYSVHDSCTPAESMWCDEVGLPCHNGLCGDTPILVDTTGQGFHLSSAHDGVLFDMGGTGTPIRYPWPAAGSGNAFLVLDRNGNGRIDGGTELFGNRSPQPVSPQPNGFSALAEYDKPQNGGTPDGVIDSRDAVFDKLRLWIDSDRDGVSQPAEFFPLSAFGIERILLRYKVEERRDEFGNLFRLKGVADGHDPQTGAPFRRNIYDVVLTVTGGRSHGSSSNVSFPPVAVLPGGNFCAVQRDGSQ